MDVNLRYDPVGDEYLAVVPRAYRPLRGGNRYYLAYTWDGWVELTPEYLTRKTRTVLESGRAHSIKRAHDRNVGYISTPVPRLYGR